MPRFQFSLANLLLAVTFAGIVLALLRCDWVGSPWQAVTCVDFSPDGKRALLGGFSGLYEHVWLKTYDDEVRRTLVLADLSSDAQPEIIPEAEFKIDEWYSVPEDYGRFAAFGTHGKTVVFPAPDGRLTVWDIATRRPVTTSTAILERRQIAVSPDGNTVAATGRLGIALWSIGQNRISLIRDSDFLYYVESIRFAPNSAMLAAAVSGPPAIIYQIDPLHKQPSSPLVKLDEYCSGGISFSSDGKRLAIGGAPIEMFDLPSGQRRSFQMPADSVMREVAFTPDGRTLAATSSDGILLIDVDSDRQLAKLPLSGQAKSVAISADGHFLLAGDMAGGATLWDLTSRRIIRSFDVIRYPRSIYPLLLTAALALWLTMWLVLRRRRIRNVRPNEPSSAPKS